MSIADFTASLRDRANIQLATEAKASLDLLVKGSIALFNPKDPLTMKSGASILSKGTISRLTKDKTSYTEENLTEVFRDTGEKQGRTALILTASDIRKLFAEIPVISTTNKEPMQLYLDYLLAVFGDKYKAKHFEFYTGDGVNASTMVSPTRFKQSKLNEVFNNKLVDRNSVTAIRGLNFSHANSLTHVASFLVYCQLADKKKIPKDTSPEVRAMEVAISRKFHRGHIYAQTTGRAMASAQILIRSGVSPNSPIIQLIELSKQLDINSSGLQGIHSAILAQVEKDFSNVKGLRMNISFQPISSSDGTGNSDTGKLSTSIALVSTLQSLMDKLVLTQNRTQREAGTVSISNSVAAKSLDNYIKVMETFLAKLSKDNGSLYNKLGALLGGTQEGTFIHKLRTSKSVSDYISDNFSSVMNTGKPTSAVKVKTPKVSATQKNTGKPSLPKLAPAFQKLAKTLIESKHATLKAIKAEEIQLRPRSGTSNLLAILQAAINQKVADNMGDGDQRRILNYRTGRFAESVEVQRISESRQGMITAFYSYMKNPYATFSEGGRQQYPKTRDPKLLISKSIREIAAPIVGNRLRSVVV